MSQTTPTSYETAVMVANLADGKKARDIRVLRTEHITSLADYFVLCSADSGPQTRSLAEHIEKSLKQQKIELIGDAQDKSDNWHLLDCGDVIIHIMRNDTRTFYEIDSFWNHADIIPSHEWQESQRQAS